MGPPRRAAHAARRLHLGCVVAVWKLILIPPRAWQVTWKPAPAPKASTAVEMQVATHIQTCTPECIHTHKCIHTKTHTYTPTHTHFHSRACTHTHNHPSRRMRTDPHTHPPTRPHTPTSPSHPPAHPPTHPPTQKQTNLHRLRLTCLIPMTSLAILAYCRATLGIYLLPMPSTMESSPCVVMKKLLQTPHQGNVHVLGVQFFWATRIVGMAGSRVGVLGGWFRNLKKPRNRL